MKNATPSLSYLSTLFSRPVVRRLTSEAGLASALHILEQNHLLTEEVRSQPLSSFFEEAYRILLKHYRCEYLYKNALVSKILIGRHSSRTASCESELLVRDSKVDLLVTNGTSIAFEIKSELDNLDRLDSQISSYAEAFDLVYVVTYEQVLSRVISSVPGWVGILELTPRYTIRTVRMAQSNIGNLNQGTIFDILRSEEYLRSIRRCFGEVPRVPNTRRYCECKRIFVTLDKHTAHDQLVTSLKGRSRWAGREEAVSKSPHSLKFHALEGSITPEHLMVLGRSMESLTP